jgi:hypothetical protein
MDSITLLRNQIKGAHEVLEGTMADVTQTQMDWAPPGIANPLGATYAHHVTSEDWIVQGILQGGAPLFQTTWAGRHGLSELQPGPGPDWGDRYRAWTRSVRVDVAAARKYAQAVYAATDAYLATLTAEDLDRTVDLSVFGMGQMPMSWIISSMIVMHIDNSCGEISCLKGIQGARGYPF